LVGINNSKRPFRIANEYIAGSQAKNAGNKQLIGSFVPEATVVNRTGIKLDDMFKQMSWGSGEYGSLENFVKSKGTKYWKSGKNLQQKVLSKDDNEIYMKLMAEKRYEDANNFYQNAIKNNAETVTITPKFTKQEMRLFSNEKITGSPQFQKQFNIDPKFRQRYYTYQNKVRNYDELIDPHEMIMTGKESDMLRKNPIAVGDNQAIALGLNNLESRVGRYIPSLYGDAWRSGVSLFNKTQKPFSLLNLGATGVKENLGTTDNENTELSSSLITPKNNSENLKKTQTSN
jgi:hypothetical protein